MKIIRESLRLFEGSIDEVSFGEVCTRKYLNSQMMNAFNVEFLVYHYNDETGNNLSERDALRDDDFIEWMNYEYEYHFNENKEKFMNIINDGAIDIWRSMMVSDEWVNDFPKSVRRLGIYWSFREESAEPHWGYNDKVKKNLIKIKSNVKNEYVDWVSTMRLSMDFSTEGEDEIRLFKNTPLCIEEITVNGKPLTLNNVINKKFLS